MIRFRNRTRDAAVAYYDSIYQNHGLGPQAKAVRIYLNGHEDNDGTC